MEITEEQNKHMLCTREVVYIPIGIYAALCMDDAQTCIKFIKLSGGLSCVYKSCQRDVHTVKGIRRFTSTLCVR
jgi:hypothetical protein